MHCAAESTSSVIGERHDIRHVTLTSGRTSRDTCDMTLTSSSRRDVIMTSSEFRLHLLLAVLLLPLTARRKSTAVLILIRSSAAAHAVH